MPEDEEGDRASALRFDEEKRQCGEPLAFLKDAAYSII